MLENLHAKLGLKDEFTTVLKVNQNDFATAFAYNIDIGDTGLFSGIFDVFSSSKNEYRGQINYESFKVKRKRRLFDMNESFAIASGNLYQKGEELVITTQIDGQNKLFIPLFIFAVFFYGIFFTVFLITSHLNSAFFFLPFLIFHAGLMFGIPIFLINRSVKRLRYELERDFFFWTKTFPSQLPNS
jgi:hypothetical protein